MLLGCLCLYLLGRYLSVCYWACVYQLLLTVCPCVVGWFMSIHYYKVSFITGYSLSIIVGKVMSTVHPLLHGYPL